MGTMQRARTERHLPLPEIPGTRTKLGRMGQAAEDRRPARDGVPVPEEQAEEGRSESPESVGASPCNGVGWGKGQFGRGGGESVESVLAPTPITGLYHSTRLAETRRAGDAAQPTSLPCQRQLGERRRAGETTKPRSDSPGIQEQNSSQRSELTRTNATDNIRVACSSSRFACPCSPRLLLVRPLHATTPERPHLTAHLPLRLVAQISNHDGKVGR